MHTSQTLPRAMDSYRASDETDEGEIGSAYRYRPPATRRWLGARSTRSELHVLSLQRPALGLHNSSVRPFRGASS